jgi:8-oxo-dGTP pyrophosphatase MutT (NUDIX family)
MSPPWNVDAEGIISPQRITKVVDTEGLPIQPAFDGARHAAVLVALAPGTRGVEVLLTRRSQQLRQHKGEISFPGGRMDPGETATQTALREAHEEVGLDPSLVTIVGELSHVNTVVSMSYIIPKVGLLDAPVPLAPQTIEADKVMWVPLAELTATGIYHGELWGSSPTDRLLHFFELADETVWGATGRMLVDLLVRLYSPSV